MAARALPLLLLLLTAISAVYSGSNQDINGTDFIRTSCNATLYPDVCYTSLSRYANVIQQSPAKLARVAVTVSFSRARGIAAFLSNLTRPGVDSDKGTAAVLKDCLSTFGDAIDQMQRSKREMLHLDVTSQESMRLQMSNVQTWMSAALTNEDTCTDEFSDAPNGSVKSDVCDRVVNARKLTSNALALINKFVDAIGSNANVH